MNVAPPPAQPKPDDRTRTMIGTMLRIRVFDEAQYDLVKDGAFPTYYTCYGREAVAAATCGNLRRDDYIATTHHGYSHLIAKGVDLKQMISEMLGKANGLCRGKGGIFHMTDLASGVLGEYPIVGASLPIAVGAALAMKMKGTEQVVVSFFGDGATGTSVFHESVNMASSLRLPIVFICENDGWEEAAGQIRFAEKASAYGVAGGILDGGDPDALLGSMGGIIDGVRRTRTPALLEARLPVPHPPTGKARISFLEMIGGGEGDFLESYLTKKTQDGALTEDDLLILKEHAKKEVQFALAYAKESPDPRGVEALEGVFS